MKSRRKKSRRSSGFSGLIDALSSISLVVIAVFLVAFVFFYIKNNSFFDALPFSKAYRATENNKAYDPSDTAVSSVGASDEVLSGLCTADNGRLVFYLSQDDAALSEQGAEEISTVTDKDGNVRLSDTWKYVDGRLYYFDKDGYSSDRLDEGAFEYFFEDDYSLSKIIYNDSFISDSDTDESYPGLASSKKLWAFVDTDKSAGNSYAVRYKKTTDSSSYELGGGYSPQFSSRYALSVVDGYIYYAVIDSRPAAAVSDAAGMLYRMKPGSDKREIAAENVKGYKVVKDESGSHVVFYYDGRSIHISDSFVVDDSMIVFSGDGDYTVDYTADKAVLMLDGIYPVTVETTQFTAGDFIYSLASDGEIRSVDPRQTVTINGYTYSVQTAESFGVMKSRVIRRDKTGKEEVISSEFSGSVKNIHALPGGSRIAAEYSSAEGDAGIISISLYGDVDYLIDSDRSGRMCLLYYVSDDYAVVKTASGDDSFRKVRLNAGYPLAVGVDPIDISVSEIIPDNENPENDLTGYIIQGPPSDGGEQSQDVSQSGPGSGITSDQPFSPETGAAVSGPPAGSGSSTVIGETVQRKGPGE